MPSILKFYQQGEIVKTYDYPLDFAKEFLEQKQKKSSEIFESDEFEALKDSETDTDFDTIENKDEKEISELIQAAEKQANEIVQAAMDEAEIIREVAEKKGEQMGFEKGYEMGYEASYLETKERLDKESKEFLRELEDIIMEVGQKKVELFYKYKTDLKNVAMAVAEKVIKVSLKSSGEVIEKMIISATEKLRSKEWAKIYVAKCDVDLMLEGDVDILRDVAHLSDKLKVIAMENESPGTCIIELPDEIIDASASTQVENIKGILNSVGI